ncbi:acyl-CoA dehydrogenase family protein [Loigolactobacillus rennini]|uniref:Butyryl-coa dehydrogenase n=1 Tax=Loigolactobacillus rennini DSM 20253 TaxID=1423796 RepID=A0A0R2D0M6_9LACO|nr:acyl-CoA dehydrogenase family protein [Loigolactobacillus rennini]KRM93059.1 butyryl-coa dehydrogenase [Loigolactobacillus rennini DSM 20253]
MALQYTEEQQEFIRLVREFAETELEPHVKQWDKEGSCPKTAFNKAFEIGLHQLEIPEEYGGLGLSYETTAMVFEELAKYDAGYAITLVSTFVALRSVILSGNKKMAKYFSNIIVPGKFAAFALSEANAGSDAGAVAASARKKDDEYILNGEKVFVTNGNLADVYIAIFRTSDDGNRGLSAFLVEHDCPGITVGKHEEKMGLRLSDTSTVNFSDVHIPLDHRIGEEGEGFKLALNSLNLSRAFVATLAVGIMQRALDESVKYATVRQQFNRPIYKFQAVQEMLADIAMQTEAARLMVNNTMKMMDKGLSVRKEGAMTKAFVSDLAQKATSNAVQIFGGYGVSCDYPVEKLLRDIKVFQIFEGTNQIQRITIANELVKTNKH